MLLTPFGEIKILVDEKPIPYSVQEGRKLEGLCPHVLGRYQIVIQFVPDGREHTISCVFDFDQSYEKTTESGERLECQSFYNDQRVKMSIGLEGETWSLGSRDLSDEYRYDYDVDYLKNGMAYLIKATTKTKQYVFGLAWIDGVDWNDSIDDCDNRDVETWFGADPTLAL